MVNLLKHRTVVDLQLGLYVTGAYLACELLDIRTVVREEDLSP
jgi:hypothetical protein